MKRQDIVIAIVGLAILAAVLYFVRNRNQNNEITVTQTPNVEESLEEKLNVQIPDDVEKAELTGENDQLGVATRDAASGSYTLTILADLIDPAEDKTYTAAVKKGDEEIGVGTLRPAKGGYLLEFQTSQDLSDFDQVVVKMDDKAVLEGSF